MAAAERMERMNLPGRPGVQRDINRLAERDARAADAEGDPTSPLPIKIKVR